LKIKASYRAIIFLDTLLGKKVSYDGKLLEPVFVDKFSSHPAIRNPDGAKRSNHRGGRTWIIFTPWGSVNKVNSPEVIEYLDKHTKVVVESYYVKVLLIEGANEPPSVAKSAESYNAE